MPKKTLILVIVLTIITSLLVFFALQTNNNSAPKQKEITTTPTKQPIVKSTSLSFDPNNIIITNTATTSSVNIILDTENDEIAGAQIELLYDPKEITNVKIQTSPNTLFGQNAQVLFNDINANTGRVSYGVATSPNQTQIRGKGPLAIVTFQKAYTSTAKITSIQFIDKTMVTKIGENDSVLKQTTPLNITFINNGYIPPVVQTTNIPTQ